MPVQGAPSWQAGRLTARAIPALIGMSARKGRGRLPLTDCFPRFPALPCQGGAGILSRAFWECNGPPAGG